MQVTADRDSEIDALAARAGSGDRRAVADLLATIQPAVVHYCRGQLGWTPSVGVLTAEDVAQDVLVAVWNSLHRYRARDGAFLAFVYGIARNKCVDAFRAMGRDRSEPTDAVPEAATSLDDGPEHLSVRSAQARQLAALLHRIPANHREVLVLRIALGYSAAETAAAMGSTPGAVRVAQHRAMARVRTLVDADVS